MSILICTRTKCIADPTGVATWQDVSNILKDVFDGAQYIVILSELCDIAYLCYV
jgi:hypothetical protein